MGKGAGQAYTDPKKLYDKEAKYGWDIGEDANFTDQLDSLRYAAAYEQVSESRGAQVNAAGARTVLIAGQAGGYLEYHRGEAAAYSLEAIARGGVPELEVTFSADGGAYEPQESAVEKMEDLGEGYARYRLTGAGAPPPGNAYLRIRWTGENAWLDTVQLALYNDGEKAGGHLLEMGRSDNAVLCAHGYCIANGESASIIFYRNYLRQWKGTLKYNGEAPDVAVYVSADNETYTEAAWYATPSVLSPEGYRETAIYTCGEPADNSRFVKVMLTKPDNVEGTDLHLTDVSLCAGGFTDPFETTLFMQEFTPNLKTRYVGERNLVYAADGGELSFVYQKNDITGFDLHVSYVEADGGASLKAYVSSDGKSYTEVGMAPFDEEEAAAGLTRRYSPDAPLPGNSNYLKFVVTGSDGFGGYRPFHLRIDGVNDPVAELRRVSEVNGVDFSDVFSVTHAAGGYTHSKENYLVEGVKAIEELGARVANLFLAVSSTMPPSYVNTYPFNYSWDTGKIKSLPDLCESEPFKRAFSSETIDTFILYVESPTQPSFKAKYAEDSYQELLEQEYDNLKAFTAYLLDTYRNSGKTFIIQTWESDWWVMEQSTYTYDKAAMERFQRWINNRQQAVEDARAATPPEGMEVYNCLELICLDRSMQGMTSVINDIVPHTKCDMYAYSAYDTTIGEHSFDAALRYLREHTPPSEVLGRDNLYIGEFGLPEMEFGDSRLFYNVLKTYKTALKNGMKYCNYWQLYCNEPVAGKVKNNSHSNEDYRGFWLVRADGTKNQTYYLLKAALRKAE